VTTPRKILDPKLDIVFKMLFGHPDNRDLLISFLNAVLKPGAPIRTVRVESDPVKACVDAKEIALDLHVEFEDGQQVNVEMQTEPRPARRERALYYGARMCAGQLGPGDGYHELPRSVVVLIVNFRELRGKRFHSIFRVREVHDQEELTDKLEIHLLELPKLKDPIESDERKLLDWGTFLSATSDAEREQLAMKDPDFQKAKVALERLSADPEAQILAEMRHRALKSYQLDLGKVHKEGVKQGQVALLLRLLTVRFGPPSPAVVERLERATEKELSDWGERLLTATSIAAVFGDP
jgi:predicted transposase/invertase (TIGR01784 family)